MRRPIATVLLSLLVLAASALALAETHDSLPQDSLALITLAHSKNGLSGPDMSPWHVRGTYRSYDEQGKPAYEGTYEEWRISASRYKVSFTNPKFTQTDFATGITLFREGSQDWLRGPELLLRGMLIEPLPDPSLLKDFTFQRQTQIAGRESFECVGLSYPIRPGVALSGSFYPAACFGPSLPVLRVYSEGSTRITFGHFASFQGHYVPRQIQVYVADKLAADLSLDTVETLKEFPDALLTPPSTAVPVDLTKIAFKDLDPSRWPMLLKKAVPVYPAQARSIGLRGTVNIRVNVGPDGHVESMQPIDGPVMLRQAALDAVHEWLYRPFEVMGKPRPIQLEVRVIFMMG